VFHRISAGPLPEKLLVPGVCKALGLPNHLAETVEQDMGDPDFLAKPPEKVIKTGAIEE